MGAEPTYETLRYARSDIVDFETWAGGFTLTRVHTPKTEGTPGLLH